MRIISCYIENFGKISDQAIDFREGLNVICQENGWGKSTLAAFLRVMFFGFQNEKARKGMANERRRYQPWQGGTYGGRLVFETDGKIYEMARTFGSKESEDRFVLRDQKTNLICQDFPVNPGEVLFHLDARSFLRTACLSQLDCQTASTDGINARLGHMTENTEDSNGYESALSKLTEMINRMNPDRKTGSLYQLRDEIGTLTFEIQKQAGIEENIARLQQSRKREQRRLEVLLREGRRLAALQNQMEVCRLNPQEQEQLLRGKETSWFGEPEEAVLSETDRERLSELEGHFLGGLEEGRDLEKDRLRVEKLFDQFRSRPEPDRAAFPEEKSRIRHEISLLRQKKQVVLKRGLIWLLICVLCLGAAALLQAGIKEYRYTLIPLIPGILFLAMFLVNREKRKDLTGRIGDLHREWREIQHPGQMANDAETVDEIFQKARFYARQYAYDDLITDQSLEQMAMILEQILTDLRDFQRLEEKKNLAKEKRQIRLEQERKENRRLSIQWSKYQKARQEYQICRQKLLQDLASDSPDDSGTNPGDDSGKGSVDDSRKGSTDDSVGEFPEASCEEPGQIDAMVIKIQKKITDISRNLLVLREQLDEINEKKELLKEKKELYATDYHKYEILCKTRTLLEQSRNTFLARYLRPVQNGFLKYYELMDGGDAMDYRIDTNLEVSVLEKGIQRAAKSLSVGRQDLLGICMRMALVDALYPKEKPFLLLDDPFVSLDDRRWQGGLEFLTKVSEEYQVIYFTCRKNSYYS